MTFFFVVFVLFVFFLLVDEGKKGQNTTKKRASETPFKWRFAGGSIMAQH